MNRLLTAISNLLFDEEQIRSALLDGMRDSDFWEPPDDGVESAEVLISPLIYASKVIDADISLVDSSLELYPQPDGSFGLRFSVDSKQALETTVYYQCLLRNREYEVPLTFKKNSSKISTNVGINQEIATTHLDSYNWRELRQQERLFDKANLYYPLIIHCESAENTKNGSSLTIFCQVVESDDGFEIEVIQQKLKTGGSTYEVHDIYGLRTSKKDKALPTCVICLDTPPDTVVLPCRHCCLCQECTHRFRLSSRKCPVCRGPVKSLLTIDRSIL